MNFFKSKKKSQPVHVSIIVHNSKQFDKKVQVDIANQFNKFFTNIGPTLAKNARKLKDRTRTG